MHKRLIVAAMLATAAHSASAQTFVVTGPGTQFTNAGSSSAPALLKRFDPVQWTSREKLQGRLRTLACRTQSVHAEQLAVVRLRLVPQRHIDDVEPLRAGPSPDSLGFLVSGL